MIFITDSFNFATSIWTGLCNEPHQFLFTMDCTWSKFKYTHQKHIKNSLVIKSVFALYIEVILIVLIIGVHYNLFFVFDSTLIFVLWWNSLDKSENMNVKLTQPKYTSNRWFGFINWVDNVNCPLSAEWKTKGLRSQDKP